MNWTSYNIATTRNYQLETNSMLVVLTVPNKLLNLIIVIVCYLVFLSLAYAVKCCVQPVKRYSLGNFNIHNVSNFRSFTSTLCLCNASFFIGNDCGCLAKNCSHIRKLLN